LLHLCPLHFGINTAILRGESSCRCDIFEMVKASLLTRLLVLLSRL
jgi:hypothetical protein